MEHQCLQFYTISHLGWDFSPLSPPPCLRHSSLHTVIKVLVSESQRNLSWKLLQFRPIKYVNYWFIVTLFKITDVAVEELPSHYRTSGSCISVWALWQRWQIGTLIIKRDWCVLGSNNLWVWGCKKWDMANRFKLAPALLGIPGLNACMRRDLKIEW